MGRYLHRWSVAGVLVASCALLLVAGPAGGTNGDTIVTAAGNGVSSSAGDGLQASEASLNQPRSVFALPGGGFVWAEPWSNRVRKVSADGVVSTVAGTGAQGYGGDGGPATAATLNFVHSAAPLADGSLLLADTQNNRIRKVSPAGIISTVAGTGSAGFTGDGGPATSARINNPRGVVGLADGGFLIPDTNNHRVRRVWPNGTITTVAGTGVQGFSGDGGPATSAQLARPFGVAPTADGGFLVVDVGNQRIRKVSAAGTITTVAGTGVAGYGGDGGPATSALVNNPHNLVAQPDGSFLIADASNERVRLVAADGTISTLTGTGVRGFSGDGGPAALAQISVPKAVGLTATGDVLVAEEQNNRIRFVGTPVAPAAAASPAVSGIARQGQTLSATSGTWTGTGPSFAYQWLRCDAAGGSCAAIGGATAKVYTAASADVGGTLRVRVTAANVAGTAVAESAPTAVVEAPLVAPSNTSPPTIAGTLRDGETLTADEGAWSGTPPLSFAYQWRRCDGTGQACVDVAGATGKTYTLQPADVGSTMRVVVTASNGAGSSVYASAVSQDAPTAQWRLGEPSGPVVDLQGFQNGTAVGSPARGVAGLLVGDADGAVSLNGSSQYVEVPGQAAWTPAAFTFEVLVRPSAVPANKTVAAAQGQFTGWWLNTGSGGALRLFVGDGSAWRAGPDGPVLQAGTTYHVVATYDGTSARLYVDGVLVSTGPATAMAPLNGANPLRLGSASSFVGQHWPGTLDEASLYPVALSAAQVDAHYDAAVTGSSATSGATAAVEAAPPVNTAAPTVSGVPQEGQELSAAAGAWTGTPPIVYSYQWQRCSPGCVDVPGATGSTYQAAAADVGSTLRVVVAGTNAAGSSSAASAETAVVAPAATAPVNTSPPVVSGSATVGGVLSSSTGSWSGSAPISYAYQWQRCSPGCVDVAGATGSTYTVQGGDAGSTLRVVVTASNAAGASSAASAETAVVPTPAGAPQFVAASSTPRPASTSLTLTAPAGAVAGDVLVGWVATDTTHAIASPPTGWTQLGTTQADGSDSSVSVFWRVLQSADPATWTGTFAAKEVGIVGVLAYRGADQAAPVEGFAQRAAGYSTVSTTASLTTQAGGRRLVALFGGDPGADARTGSPDATAGAVERLEGQNGLLGFVYAEDVAQAAAGPLSLSVTWNGGESSASFLLALAAPAGAPSAPANTSPPAVSGTAREGEVLTASSGTWTGSQPLSYAYQWQRCTPGCVDVAGAVGSAYTPVAADVGSSLRVVVTASNAVGSSSASSAQTATVTAAATSGTLTVNVAAGGDDGDVAMFGPASAGYPPTGGPSVNSTWTGFTIGRRLAFGDFEVLVGLVRFDTSALPDDATVTSATLRVYVASQKDADDRTLVGEWVSPAQWPIDTSDFVLNVGTSALPGADVGALTKDRTHDLSLVGLANVSTTGYTALRLGISGGQPSGDNLLQLASLEHATRPEPQLVLTWTRP